MPDLLILVAVGVFIVTVYTLFDKVDTKSIARSIRREHKRRDLEREIRDRERLDIETVLRDSPMGPGNVRVEETDWVAALGLGTRQWRITDPDDGKVFYTDDVGIAIDNLVEWDCKVEPLRAEQEGSDRP